MFQFVAWTPFLNAPCNKWSPQLPIIIKAGFSSFFRSLQGPVHTGPSLFWGLHSKLSKTFVTQTFNRTVPWFEKISCCRRTKELESKYLALGWFKYLFQKRIIISIWQFWKLSFKLSSKGTEKNGYDFISLIKILLRCEATSKFGKYASLAFPILYFSAVLLSENMAVKIQLLSSHEFIE